MNEASHLGCSSRGLQPGSSRTPTSIGGALGSGKKTRPPPPSPGRCPDFPRETTAPPAPHSAKRFPPLLSPLRTAAAAAGFGAGAGYVTRPPEPRGGREGGRAREAGAGGGPTGRRREGMAGRQRDRIHNAGIKGPRRPALTATC